MENLEGWDTCESTYDVTVSELVNTDWSDGYETHGSRVTREDDPMDSYGGLTGAQVVNAIAALTPVFENDCLS